MIKLALSQSTARHRTEFNRSEDGIATQIVCGVNNAAGEHHSVKLSLEHGQ